MEQGTNGEELYKVDTIADGLRSTGYKTTYNAIAEIVDNSIEGNAKDVFIIGSQDLVFDQKKITKFAILDNGDGMSDDILSKCLQIGFSTRSARKGMGRYGVGLPQASFSVSPRVEVYSWQNGYENAKRVFIDLDLVTNGQQTKIFGPDAESIPEEYQKFITFNDGKKTHDFSQHGTLVIWPKCDRVTHKQWNTCSRHISFDLGRKYRWMLNDNSVVICTVEQHDFSTFKSILPNDPLFLMKKSQFCMKESISDSDANCQPYNEESGYTETMFEPYVTEENKTGIVNKEVYYFDKDGTKKYSTVTIRFSIVKEKYYDQHIITKNPGSLPYGKCALANQGISIIRQKREIDFGDFDFFSNENNPFHRWWGCEISFTPELDEAFGISNNKQQVVLKEISDDDLQDYDGDEPLWAQLRDIVKGTINKMVIANQERRKGSRSNGTQTTTTAVSETIKNAESENPDIVVENQRTPLEITPEIKELVKKELASEGFDTTSELTDEQVKQYLDSNTRISYKSCGQRGTFIDYDYDLGVLKIIINKDHPFYTSFVISSYTNDKMKLTFELFLAALVKSIYKLHMTDEKNMDKLVDSINVLLKNYIKGQL